MPSDHEPAEADMSSKALAALEPRVEAFHSAVAAAEDEVRSYVAHTRGMTEFKGEQALVELGPFALGRIDPERFAQLLGDAGELTPQEESVLARADRVMASFVADRDMHLVSVAPGGDLRDAVKDAFSWIGKVFGASRAVELARAGTFDSEQHNHFLGAMPFRFWNRAERQLAPPLVVEVRGEDCVPAGLSEFLDGTVSIVLVAKGPTTPAPLARLITPGTFVMQTTDPADLSRMAASHHPGIALLFDEARPGQALFVHDPDAGKAAWQRLTVQHLPEQPTVGRGRRAPRWLEELTHLAALATRPGSAAAAEGDPGAEAGGARTAAGTPVADGQSRDAAAVRAGPAAAAKDDPAATLAAWLLSQTDVGGL